MKIRRGNTYWVRNTVTNEFAQIRITDVLDYLGHYVVGGVLSPHQIHVTRGVGDVDERYSAFVVLQEPDQAIEVFTRYLKGLPLALCDRPGPALASETYVGDQIRIVNSGRSAWGSLDGTDKSSRLDRCFRAVDLYLYMKEHGRPPAWFKALRRGRNGT